MSRTITPREPEPNVLEQTPPEDAQHRVDVLAYQMLKRVKDRSSNPVLDMLWSNLKNPLADYLNQTLGPEPAQVKRIPRTRSKHNTRRRRSSRSRKVSP